MSLPLTILCSSYRPTRRGPTDSETKETSVCMCEDREAKRRRGTIRTPLFTSQSTQTRVDPTAEEQSAGQIKKEVRQPGVNIYARRLIISPMLGPHGALWEMPAPAGAARCPRCTESCRTQPPSNKRRTVFGRQNLRRERHFKREPFILRPRSDL